MKRLLLLLLLAAPAFGQVPVALTPIPRPQFADNNGVPLAGGCLSFFNAGTTTPAPTFSDITGNFQNTNPLTLDSAGRATIYLQNQEYKVQLNAAPGTGSCAPGNLGAQIWIQDNVSAFQVIIGTQTILFAGVTSDPTGQAGLMDYRTDIPCFRGFTTVWDCFVQTNLTQTLTNKTLASPVFTGTATGLAASSPVFTNPSVNGVVMSGPPATYITIANDPTTGTTLNTLTKLLPNVSPLAVISATNDTGGVIGICIAGCGKTGSATIQQSGTVSCIFDNSVTNGNYVVIGASGDCHGQAPYPVTTQAVGKVLATGAPATYSMILFPPEIQVPTGRIAIADLPSQNANISSTPIFTPSSAGMFRFSCISVITTAASTSSTLPQCNLQFTDGDSSTSQSVNICAGSSTNVVGQLCNPGSNANSLMFFAKAGVSISWSTSGYASSGGTQMVYAVHIRLEGPI